MCGNASPRIPLIDDLTKDPIPAGSNILVEFDPASQWYNASLSIAAGWLKDGGIVEYNTSVQSVAKIRSKMRRLELDVDALERELELLDWYTATLGKDYTEKKKGGGRFFEQIRLRDYAEEDVRVPERCWTLRDNIGFAIGSVTESVHVAAWGRVP